jgi:hypothetical protein
MVKWSECAGDFAADGSLRDIYVLHGGLHAWDALLRMSRQVDTRFSIDGVTTPLPERAHDVFVRRADAAPLLSISWQGIELCAHFFDEADVELDFVPNVIQGQQGLDRLCSFLRELASATNRDVIVTPENWPQSPILRAQPTGEICYQAPSGAA